MPNIIEVQTDLQKLTNKKIAAVSWGCSIHWLLGIVILGIMILLFGG